jgi:poly(hydroxyalkanoate) depolymerase family esterase
MPDGVPNTKVIAMKNHLPDSLLQATRLTTGGRLSEATAALQKMLSGRAESGKAEATAQRNPLTIEGVVDPARLARGNHAPQTWARFSKAGGGRTFASAQLKLKPAVSHPLCGFFEQGSHGNFQLPVGGLAPLSANRAPVIVSDGAQFVAKTFSNQAGSRSYKLYVPSGYHGQAVPLIVMLHGCTQSPDDFAVGTQMNAAAEEHTILIAYPGQTSSANMQKCWNWFSEGDQQRDRGEPSLIAGITREVMRDYEIDERRVYVAGLSAGGAAAAVMGNTYPDLYAAIGVHSGLPCGAARDMPSAFAAMQRGGKGSPHETASSPRTELLGRLVPAIVFHGDRDTTVNPLNADAVVVQSAQGEALGAQVESGQVPGGLAYSRTLYNDATGTTMIEQWLVKGAGHAWFGGSLSGSYTEPSGPDATGEMLRFFLEHPHPASA